jgi:hypothetical protein
MRARRDPLPRLRKMCLALPEAHEQVAWWIMAALDAEG